MKKYIAAALSFALASCLSGCGSSNSSSSSAPRTAAASAAAANAEDTAAAAENTSAAVTTDENGYTHYPTPEDVNDFTGVDFSAPSIKVSFGDYDKMFETSKAIQNYQLEGVVVEIDGVIKNTAMSHSIQMYNADKSQSVGTELHIIGLDDKDYPEDDTRIHIVGIVRPLNEYAHGIYAAPENYFKAE